MSRGEWWTLVILGGVCDFLLILILVYVRFIWDINEKQWNMLWSHFHADTSQLYLGNDASGQLGQGPGGMLGRSGANIPKGLRDAGERSPGVR